MSSFAILSVPRVLVHIVDAASTEGRDPIDDIYKISKSHPVLGQSFGVVFLCKELLTKR